MNAEPAKITHTRFDTTFELNGKEILIDYTRTAKNVTEAGYAIIQDRYLNEGESDPQESLARVACTYADDSEHAQRLYDYFSMNWAYPATPVHANGGTAKGLPISCFLNQPEDSREGLGEHYHENLWLSTSGGGIGSDWSKIRSKDTATSKGNKTTGVIPFIKVIDSLTVASWQGSTRRGATAVYLSVRHPEIKEFIEIRKPTGDANRRSLNIHNAVSIPDDFMEAVTQGTPWDLIDPHTQEVVETIDARDLWMKILSLRVATGEPYLFFEDTANKALPQELKDKGLRVNSSNLCTEIMLPTSADRTAVCCLSSVNLEYFDEWRDNEKFLEDLLRMLDNVLQDFIDNCPNYLWRAKNSAQSERSIGLGAMGFHSYLQKKGIPWETPMATGQNIMMFSHIQKKCLAANLKLGKEKGEAPDMKGSGKRFAHMNAIAPNANISILCGNVSPSIEPFNANAFTQKTHSGVFLIKNKALDKLFVEKYNFKEKDLDKVWQSVIINKGSVQHLDFLTENEKSVFKTAMELDQRWVVEHASTRQPFIDQGQSVNVFVNPTITKNELHQLHKQAWEKGLKALYYCRTESVGSTANISKELDWGTPVEPKVTFSETSSECLSCEG